MTILAPLVAHTEQCAADDEACLLLPSDCRNLHMPQELATLFTERPMDPPPVDETLAPLDLGEHCDFERRAGSNMTVDEFMASFALQNRPVILTGLTDSWPARQWNRGDLFDTSESPVLRMGIAVQTMIRAYQWALLRDKRYHMPQVPLCQEQNLYLDLNRDPSHPFMQKLIRCGYTRPHLFRTDFFRHCTRAYNKTYARRWLLIASAGSGSCWHVDPYNTSAWNAVLAGSKRWALYPPASPFPPPGTQGRHPVPAYGADRKNWGISSPWLWAENEKGAKDYFERVLPSLAEEEQPQQCMVREGELLFVPSGWAHLVLNTEASLAITENVMDESNSKAVMAELRKRPSKSQPRRCLKRIKTGLLQELEVEGGGGGSGGEVRRGAFDAPGTAYR